MVRTEVVGGIDVARADVAQLVKVRQNVPRLAKIDHLAFGEEQDQVERRHHLGARLVDGADDGSALESVVCVVCARARVAESVLAAAAAVVVESEATI
jgi:hypothetical protein